MERCYLKSCLMINRPNVNLKSDISLGFEGETLLLIAPVPGYCLPFHFFWHCRNQQN